MERLSQVGLNVLESLLSMQGNTVETLATSAGQTLVLHIEQI